MDDLDEDMLWVPAFALMGRPSGDESLPGSGAGDWEYALFIDCPHCGYVHPVTQA